METQQKDHQNQCTTLKKSIKDWTLQELIISSMWFQCFIEAFDFTEGFTIQSQSDYNMILDQISLWEIDISVSRIHLLSGTITLLL